MMNPTGRPPKYDLLLDHLEDHDLYSAALITKYATSHGLLRSTCETSLDLAKTRLRVAMAGLARNRRFPAEGDGLIYLPGQCPTPGWFGWRWKEAYS